MSQFVEYQRGRLHLHILQTTQFRTRHFLMRLCQPVTREAVTAGALLPYLWMEGTQRLPTPLDLARHTDDLFGAVLRTSTSKRGSQQIAEVYASSPEESRLDDVAGVFEQVVDLAHQVVTDPLRGDNGFADTAVQRSKNLQAKRIASLTDDKMTYSMEQCLQNVCKGRPESLPRLGFAEELDDLSSSDLWSTHEALMRNAQVYAYLIGDFENPEQMAEQHLAKLASLFGTSAEQPALARLEPVPKRTSDAQPELIVEHQNVAQGKLNLGFRTGLSLADADYPALIVCNGILGGFPHSKLFVNVREKASLAYYASSRLDGLTGLVAVQTGIEPGVLEQARQIILEQVRSIQRGEITDAELSLTQRALQNQYRQSLDQPITRAEFHFTGKLAGINRDVTDLMSAVAQVSIADVKRVSQNLELDTVYFLRNQEETAHAQ